MTTTTVPKTLTTSFDGPLGYYFLTGSRGHDLTARFTLEYVRPHTYSADDGFEPLVIVKNADWPTTWSEMHARMAHQHVEATMRTVLPPVEYAE